MQVYGEGEGFVQEKLQRYAFIYAEVGKLTYNGS